MDHYVTGTLIKTLREKYGMTQSELAGKICVSDKAVSKWETGRGFPDISLIEPLSQALRISVPELLCGQTVVNGNRGANMLKSRFYVCPVCGNALFARGDALISCCGIQLPPMEAEEPDAGHAVSVQHMEDEICVSADHAMTKQHYLTFMAYVTMDHCEIRTLYPEGSRETRFFYRGSGRVYVCCNQHGLYRMEI